MLACWGSYGDLFPYLAIALRLKTLGHTPVLATCPYYREMVVGHGVAFHGVGPDVNPDDAGTIRRVMDPAKGTEVIVRELLVPHVRQSFEALSEAVRGADLLVSHPVTFAAPLVGDARSVPWVSSVLAPTSMFSLHDFPVLPPIPWVLRLARQTTWTARAFMAIARRVTDSWTAPVRAFRRELGLDDRGDPLYEGQFSPRGTLALFSSIFGSPQPDWPVGTRTTGFVFHHSGPALPPALAAYLDAGPAPIVFTLGSSAVGAAGAFYDESLAAAAALKRRAVLLVGRNSRLREDATLPGDAIAVEYAPHDLLFPRAAAVVHHGGIGTTAQALASGRPMLVVPHAHDQPDNAFRAVRLGVARAVDARRYRRRVAAAHLDRLMIEDRYAQCSARIGRLIAREDGAAAAADAILQHAAVAAR